MIRVVHAFFTVSRASGEFEVGTVPFNQHKVRLIANTGNVKIRTLNDLNVNNHITRCGHFANVQAILTLD